MKKPKTDFKPFRVGTVFNPIKTKNKKVILKEIEILYPHRLNAMAIDPSKIASNDNLIYTPGEIVFSIKIYNKIKIKLIKKNQCLISKRSKRKSLIKHTFLLMKKAIGFKNGFWIDVDNKNEIKHVGLGSSGSLIAGVASAINEMCGNPMKNNDLIRYLAQNHGEEIKGDKEYIVPVQCIGGSAASGNYEGGLLIIVGESCVINKMYVDDKYSVILGIPKNFKASDAKKALKEELDNIQGFINCGKKYGLKIAYNILHILLPAMQTKDLRKIGDIIYDYRFNMGSIKNCSFSYSKLPEITNNLSFLKKKNIADVLSVSSVGPGIFVITKKPSLCINYFKKNGLKVYQTKIENDKYSILNKKIYLDDEIDFWNKLDIVKHFKEKKENPEVKEILLKVKNKRNKKVLDLGCGGGRHTELASNLGFNVYAIDPSKSMVTVTKKRIKKSNNVKLSSMSKIPFSSNFFDIVISTGVFHQARSKEEYKQAIKEVSRVIKNKGILITDIFTSSVYDKTFTSINKNTVLIKKGLYMTLLSKEEYIRLMNKYGFKVYTESKEEIKKINNGLRSILRVSFVKLSFNHK